MAKGSVGKTKNEKNKDRAFYTLTLSTKNPDDIKKIEYLRDRSTTEVLKKGIDMQMEEENQSKVNEQILQLLQNASGSNQLIIQLLTQLLVSANGNNGQQMQLNHVKVDDVVAQLNQIANIPQQNNEQAATTEVKEVVVEKVENTEEPKQEVKEVTSKEDQKRIEIAKQKAEDAMKKLPF
ncbi:hypothetical protein [Bacillus sp. Brlt_9]|uniref:hypothetical protein n=1 Tax=Bacillus sp. Brlt_9 TaxID=3110916 RepID=UPI003F7C66AB